MTFQRLVVDLSHGATDTAALRDAAAFARLLGVDLHGLFIEDEALFGLADLPFAREYRVLGDGWTKLDAGRIEADLQHLAEAMRARLARLGVPNAFEVTRGDPATVIAELVTATDIVVMETSSRPMPRLTARSGGLLLMPSRRGRDRGAIVAIINNADDPALPPATAIAKAAHEPLHIYHPAGASIHIKNARVLPGNRPLAEALGGERERLIVMTRDHNLSVATELSRARTAPVLLVEAQPGSDRTTR